MTFFPTDNLFLTTRHLAERGNVMAFHIHIPHNPTRHLRSDAWQFRVAFAATFLAALVPILFSRLTLSHWNGTVGRGSIFHEARARADRIVPFIFMG